MAFLLAFSASWLLALADIPPPVIGFIVMVVILAVIILIIVKWYQYWVKKGLEEYERQKRARQ